MVSDLCRRLECNGRVFEGYGKLVYYILGCSGAGTGLKWAQHGYFDVVWRVLGYGSVRGMVSDVFWRLECNGRVYEGYWECLWCGFRCVWVFRM